MMAPLSGLIVCASMVLAGLMALGVIAAHPLWLTVHIILTLAAGSYLCRHWLSRRALFGLVETQQGELFRLAIAQLISRSSLGRVRARLMLRKCQGLSLSGQSLSTLTAVTEYFDTVKTKYQDHVSVLATAAEANLQLGQLFWSRQNIQEANKHPHAHQHAWLRTVEARLRYHEGDYRGAYELLNSVQAKQAFPFTRVLRSRHMLWFGDVLAALGEQPRAQDAFEKAKAMSPKSLYGRHALTRRHPPVPSRLSTQARAR